MKKNDQVYWDAVMKRTDLLKKEALNEKRNK